MMVASSLSLSLSFSLSLYKRDFYNVTVLEYTTNYTLEALFSKGITKWVRLEEISVFLHLVSCLATARGLQLDT